MNELLAKKLWDSKEYFSKGKRGLIYVANHNNKKFVIKVKNPESFANGTILKEYENNSLLNTISVGPKVFWFDEKKDFMIREFVDGKDFFEWIKELKKRGGKEKIKKFFLELLNQCKKMDELFINKLEMNHPHKDLLVVNNKPIIIDFERCKKTISPKNITQLCQFIISKNVDKVLREHSININKEEIIKLANKYKKENKHYEDIIRKIARS